jgi:hypothetical protein
MNAEKQIKVKIKMLSMNAHVSTLLRQCQKSLDLAKSRIRKLLVSKGVKLTLLRRRSKLKTLY